MPYNDLASSDTKKPRNFDSSSDEEVFDNPPAPVRPPRGGSTQKVNFVTFPVSSSSSSSSSSGSVAAVDARASVGVINAARKGRGQAKKAAPTQKTVRPPRGGRDDEHISTDEDGPAFDNDDTDDDCQVAVDPQAFIAGPGDPPPPLVVVGMPGKRRNLSCWEGLSDVDVFFRLAGPMLLHTLRCTNEALQRKEKDAPFITQAESFSFIRLKIFCSAIHLPNIHMYYYSKDLDLLGVTLPDFKTRLPSALYVRIVQNLKFEDPNLRDPAVVDVAWKVRTTTNLVKNACQETNENPSQNLTVDEGMRKCKAAIFTHIPNKPVDEGFKWCMLTL